MAGERAELSGYGAIVLYVSGGPLIYTALLILNSIIHWLSIAQS